MNEIIKRPESLPDTIERLRQYIVIAKERVKAKEAELRAIKKSGIDLGKEVYEAKLKDTQEEATAVIFAEVKLGELLKDHTSRGGSMDGKRGSEKSLPSGITHKQSYYAQLLYRYRDIIEEIIIPVIKRRDIPRRSIILNKIERDKRKEPNVLMPIEGIFEVIVIDPPWSYGTIKDPNSRRVGAPYKELTQEQLKEFKLPAAENCVLWLWTTHRFIRDAFELIDVWRFDYKLIFIWDKVKLGIGEWLRCQIEFCLLAIKGKPRWNLTNERDILSISRSVHSEKPDEFYEMVEKLCPTLGERIDIFARKPRPNWVSIGDEVE